MLVEGNRSALVIERGATLRLDSNLFHMRIGLIIGETQLRKNHETLLVMTSSYYLYPYLTPSNRKGDLNWFALQTVCIAV